MISTEEYRAWLKHFDPPDRPPLPLKDPPPTVEELRAILKSHYNMLL
jgi:hypothetical protein